MSAPRGRHPVRPSELPPDLPVFDRFASRATVLAGRAPFFAACALLVVIWLPSLLWFSLDTWQLTIQTVTAIVTFLLVALLQNSQARSDSATQHKLNEIADALANLISASDLGSTDLRRDVDELKAAVGLEERERS